MREDLLVQKMREAIRNYAKIPPEVRHRKMVEAGIIDEQGRVLVRMPEPPKMKKAKKKKPEADSSSETASQENGDGLNGATCFMSEEVLLQRMEEAIRKGAKVPPEVRHRRMVEAGVIDEQGRVLVRMPEPPKMKRAKKKKPKADS